jgi:hypothetical protein
MVETCREKGDDGWVKRCTRLEVVERDPEVDQGKRGRQC